MSMVKHFKWVWNKRAITCAGGLVLCDTFLHDFTLTWLENLHLFSNFHDNIQFHVIWNRRFMAVFIYCRRLAESDIILMLSVTCMDYIGDIITWLIELPVQ
jgi:hypothetical protein